MVMVMRGHIMTKPGLTQVYTKLSGNGAFITLGGWALFTWGADSFRKLQNGIGAKCAQENGAISVIQGHNGQKRNIIAKHFLF